MAQAAEGMNRRVCIADHDELGHLEYDVPAGLDVKLCPWHNSDGSFDRVAYMETHSAVGEISLPPHYPSVLRFLIEAVASGRHENPRQAIGSIIDITRYLSLTEPQTILQLLREMGYYGPYGK